MAMLQRRVPVSWQRRHRCTAQGWMHQLQLRWCHESRNASTVHQEWRWHVRLLVLLRLLHLLLALLLLLSNRVMSRHQQPALATRQRVLILHPGHPRRTLAAARLCGSFAELCHQTSLSVWRV